MTQDDRTARARRLAQYGSSDERIEALTGLTLVEIIVLRAEAASDRSVPFHAHSSRPDPPRTA